MDRNAIQRSAFAIGVALFALSTGAGLVGEIATRHRLPPLVPSPFEHANEQIRAGQQQAVLEQYQMAAAIAPNVSWSRLQLGFALDGTGDPSGARREFELAARLDPTSLVAHTSAAQLALAQGDTAAARTHVERARALAANRGAQIDPALLRAVGLTPTPTTPTTPTGRP